MRSEWSDRKHGKKGGDEKKVEREICTWGFVSKPNIQSVVGGLLLMKFGVDRFFCRCISLYPP